MGPQNIHPHPPPLKNALWPEMGGRGGGVAYIISPRINGLHFTCSLFFPQSLGLQMPCFWQTVPFVTCRKQGCLMKTAKMTSIHSTHQKQEAFCSSDPRKRHEKDENGGQHSRKSMVYQKQGFCNPDHRHYQDKEWVLTEHGTFLHLSLIPPILTLQHSIPPGILCCKVS